MRAGQPVVVTKTLHKVPMTATVKKRWTVATEKINFLNEISMVNTHFAS